MKLNLHWKPVLAVTSLSIGLAACSGAEEAMDAAADEIASVGGEPLTIAEGPDVCIKAAIEHLGANAKVAEITSFFSAGAEVDPDADEPKGQLRVCTVDYQNPEDPRKLLSMRLDPNTGKFGDPAQVEISVSGDAADFNLDDFLIPLSDVDTSGLAAKLEEQKTRLDEAFSSHAWTGIRLTEPDVFNDVHLIRVDVEGRIKSNDIKENGYAEFSVDGKTMTQDSLLP